MNAKVYTTMVLSFIGRLYGFSLLSIDCGGENVMSDGVVGCFAQRDDIFYASFENATMYYEGLDVYICQGRTDPAP